LAALLGSLTRNPEARAAVEGEFGGKIEGRITIGVESTGSAGGGAPEESCLNKQTFLYLHFLAN
jgi:hypothetical protein